MRFQPPPLTSFRTKSPGGLSRLDQPTWAARVLLVSLTMCGLFVCEAAAEGRKQQPELYVPQPEHFRNAYDADKSNGARQSWNEYYGWVEVFYDGNIFVSGWTSQAKRVGEQVDDPRVRAEIVIRLNELGRRISQEWSKDNSIRRLNSDHLAAFGRQLAQARKVDDRSGAAIREALGEIEKAVGQRNKKSKVSSLSK